MDYKKVGKMMFRINFDLFYELKQGSIVSIYYSDDKLGNESTSLYRLKNNTLEMKHIDHLNHKTYDWERCDCMSLHPNSVFKIEERADF